MLTGGNPATDTIDKVEKKVLLLDVCHTLYHSNTTFDFLAWYFSDNPAYQSLAKKRSSTLNRICARLGFKDHIREHAVGLLKGIPRQKLESAAVSFASTLRPIDPIQAALRNFKEQGYEPILLSSSLDFIVLAVAKQLDIHSIHATELNYQDSVCSGTIKHDLLNTKAQIIKTRYAGLESVFITDNRTDLNCASEVSKFIAVFHSKDSGNANFWHRHGIRDTLTYG